MAKKQIKDFKCKNCRFLDENTGAIHYPKAVGICTRLGVYPTANWFCADFKTKETFKKGKNK